MPNLMQRAAAWHAAKLQTVGGRSVTYHRRTKTISLTGTPALHEYQVIDSEGLTTLVVATDWIFTTSELVIDGTLITPQAGDWLEETLNDVLVRYDVLPIGDEPPAKQLDTSGKETLVHTKKVR